MRRTGLGQGQGLRGVHDKRCQDQAVWIACIQVRLLTDNMVCRALQTKDGNHTTSKLLHLLVGNSESTFLGLKAHSMGPNMGPQLVVIASMLIVMIASMIIVNNPNSGFGVTSMVGINALSYKLL